MKTDFFELISGLSITGNLKINIQPQQSGQLIVSVLLTNDAVKDKAVKAIPPMLLSGTATELNEGFFIAITKPLQDTHQLFMNMAEHEKAVSKARTENSMTKNSSAGSNKSGDRRKFDEQMKKVTDLEAKKKYGEAIGQMPTTKQYPAYADEIKTKMNELRTKHGSLSLFEDEPQSDTSTEEKEDDGFDEDNDDINDDDDPPFEPDEDNDDDKDNDNN